MRHPAPRTVPLVLLAAAGLALSACAPTPSSADAGAGTPDTVTVTGAQPALVLIEEDGESYLGEDGDTARGAVPVPFQPKAVVTFDIGTLDTLDAIGAGDSIVGIPDIALPDYLSAYAELPKVGTLFEPDFEAVAELDPDLIVTAARSTSSYDDLAEIATTIDLTAVAGGTFSPAAAIVRATQLGEVFGREDVVAELTADIARTEADISAVAGDLGPTLLLSVSGGEYGAFAEGSRFGYFFDELGFVPAVAAAELPGQEGSPHGDLVTNEFILRADPAAILVFDRAAATGSSEGGSAEETLDNELVAQTAAAQDGAIVYLPASELYIVTSGLTAVGNVLDAVSAAVTR